MDGTDETMDRIGAAVEQGRAGDTAGARAELARLWSEIGPDGDPFHRCVLAHYLADLQDDDGDELWWDERALAAVAGLTDERARRHHASLQVRGFLPSLHLNLADDHRRLGAVEPAGAHLAAARRYAAELPEDGYGSVVRGGIANVAAALDARSVAPLPSSPSAR